MEKKDQRMTSSSSEIVSRLERLERQNRSLRGLLLLVAGALGVFLMGGAGSKSVVQEVVESESFVVKDKSGKIRVRMGLEADGSSGLRIFDANGVLRVKTVLTAEGVAGLSLNSLKEVKSVGLAADKDGSGVIFLGEDDQMGRFAVQNLKDETSLYILDKKKQPRVELRSTSGGDANLSLFKGLNDGVSLKVKSDGTSRIDVGGPIKKQTSITLMRGPDGGSTLDMGETGTRRALLFASPDGKAGLGVQSGADQSMVGLFSRPDEPASLVATDSKGRTRIKMGAIKNDQPDVIFYDANGSGKAMIKD